MKRRPTVSVVIPTYNRKDYVQQAIDSVLAQTYTDYEIIVVDDGSSDGTGDALRARYGDGIRYVWQPNQGESAARNRGIDMAQGEFIAFLDSDDIWLPQKLERQMAYAASHPDAHWISSGWRVTDISRTVVFEERRPWEEPAHEDHALRLLQFPSVPSVTVLRRLCLTHVGGFDTQLRYKEDHDLWLRLLDAGHDIAFVREILAEFRVHESNQSQNGSFIQSQDGLHPVLERFFLRQNPTSEYYRMREAVYARAHLIQASYSFESQDVPRALEHLERALALDPTLWEDNGKIALDIVLGFAHGYCVEDPMAYTRLVLTVLPDQPFAVRARYSKLMGRAAAGAYFKAARCEDWAVVRTSFVAILRHDRTWLRNRGLWSILLTALMGQDRAERIRASLRNVLNIAQDPPSEPAS